MDRISPVKKQKLITGNDLDSFNEEVNNYLRDGKYKVVPGTLSAAISKTTYDNGFGDRVSTTEAYAVVLEEV